jgi:hypothetical protein
VCVSMSLRSVPVGPVRRLSSIPTFVFFVYLVVQLSGMGFSVREQGAYLKAHLGSSSGLICVICGSTPLVRSQSVCKQTASTSN